ncbi:hypothetical protein VP1G_11222 [Cytospora mali]|uniref:Uncharacterized protein n=1 Tax=Cytospora mali TaxID=578113 RepID=A0A194VBQ3_CYTMA|nr:hypothetical protein VP1G_11222 [Valsa mali var. pyri (nom. inval.)]
MADSIRVSIPSASDAGDESMGPHADDSISGDTPVQSSRPQKRRRIPVACGACRSKKSRLVESRLSQLESDVRSLKDQQSQGGSVRSEPIMGDRRESIASYFLPMSAQEPEAEDFVVSPDATDGIGSIEFTKEEDSGYYGMNASCSTKNKFDLISREFRTFLQHSIHA